MENKAAKKVYIEYLRVAAMVAVVLSHIGSTAASDFPDSYHTPAGALYSSVVNLLHFAVPVFFMISGALMLDSKKELTIEKLFKKYILKYAAVILVFGWGYAFIEEVFNDRSISLGHFVRSFCNMLQRKTWAHMWYLYALLGILFLVPVLRLMVRHFSDEQMKYWIGISVLFLSIIPMVELWTGKRSGIVFPLNREFSLYMLLGFWIEYGYIKISKKTAAAGIIISIPFLVAGAYLKALYGINLGAGEYYSPAVLLYSVCIFSLFKYSGKWAGLEGGKIHKAVGFLSGVSFGVYLVQDWLIAQTETRLFEPLCQVLPAFAAVLAWEMIVFGIALAAVWVMRRIPVLKKLL